MSDTTTQTSSEPTVSETERLPLCDFGIAPENLRAGEPADEAIPELANTIEAAGLLYPLLVRPGRKSEKPWMVLDGRRRLLGLELLAGEGRIGPDFSVKAEVVRDKGQQAAAIVVSNAQRAPVHIADVIVAIGKLKALKLTPAKIAASLGYEEVEVKRLQRLAGLPKPALEALRRGRINLRTAKLLARITEVEALAHFTAQAEAGCLSEYALTHHLHRRPGLDDPMFDLIGVERYREAGGRIDADLFGEFNDVVLDPDKLQALWKARVDVLVQTLKARGYAVYYQGQESYRAPGDFEWGDATSASRLGADRRSAWDDAGRHADELAEALSQGERWSESRDGDLTAFLIARLEQEVALYGADRIGAVSLYPEIGTGFGIQVYLKPAEAMQESSPEIDTGGDAAPLDGAPEEPGRPYREEVVVPRQEVDVEGRNHALHETYTDVATRGLIRSLAEDPAAALTVLVARLFVVQALQSSAVSEHAASTLQARRYSRGGLPPIPGLDGTVRERLEERRQAYLASGQRPIPWVDSLPHGEKMELLAELVALSLDLREPTSNHLRHGSRADAAEIAELTSHEITAYWTPDATFLGQHTKGQLMAALGVMEADLTPTKGMRKEDLVAYTGTVAAEMRWAPPALSCRTELTIVSGGSSVDDDDADSGADGVEADPFPDGEALPAAA